jgi:hypothetical protein
MGEETKGVLRVMRFVMGVSRATSAAGKPIVRLGWYIQCMASPLEGA